MFARIGRVFLWLFAIVGVVSSVTLGLTLWSIDQWIGEHSATPEPAETIVLSLDFRQALVDAPPQSPLTALVEGPSPALRDMVAAIDRARSDPHVTGLVAEFGHDTFGMATAQELQGAIERFRDSGKPVIAYADSFGELGGGNFSYLLATAFDEIWLGPMGGVGLTGLFSQMPFAERGLDDLGIEPEVVRRGAYKTFPDIATEDGLSPEHREMVEALLDSLYEQLVAGIADGRELAPETVASLIDTGPLLAQEALDAGLIDGIEHRTGLRADLDARFGDDAAWMGGADYLALGVEDEEPAENRIALIYAVGPVVLGEEERSPLDGGSSVIAAESTALVIEDAVADESIDAIVLRLNTPGGSAVASEVVRRAVLHAEDQGKPLIVSMGDVAASGGYWIAAGADTIVAQPATITGSIGVFSVGFATRAFWRDIGITWDQVQRGRHAGMWSPIDPMSGSELDRMTVIIDDVYENFLTVVSDGRGLDRQTVDGIGQGRVWTGEQALDLGLVDRLGGFDEALSAAREALDLAADAPIQVEIRPEPPSPFDLLAQFLGTGVGPDAQTQALLDRLTPLIDAAAPITADPGAQLLRMPAIGLPHY